jgi:Sec-independent protein secretion pathway component TatC
LSQISLGIPTVLLYELSIFAVVFVERKREAAAKAKEGDGAEAAG